MYDFENLPELLVVPGDKGWGIVWFSQMERSWWILPTARLDNTMVITISGHLSLYHHHQQTKQPEEFYQVWQTDRPRPTMRRWPGIRQGPTLRWWPGLRPRPTMRRCPGLRPRPTMRRCPGLRPRPTIRRWSGLRPRSRYHNNQRVQPSFWTAAAGWEKWRQSVVGSNYVKVQVGGGDHLDLSKCNFKT